MRKYFPAWPRSRSAVSEVSVRRGNFQLIWIKTFYWWKLALWRDLVGIISPPRWDNFSHMNSPYDYEKTLWKELRQPRCLNTENEQHHLNLIRCLRPYLTVTTLLIGYELHLSWTKSVGRNKSKIQGRRKGFQSGTIKSVVGHRGGLRKKMFEFETL